VLALLAVLSRSAARLPAALAALAEARAAAARVQRVLGLRRLGLGRLLGPPGPGAPLGQGRAGAGGGVELRDATVGWLAGGGGEGAEGEREGGGGVTMGGVGGTWAVLEGLTLKLRPGACTVVCGAGKTALLLALAVPHHLPFTAPHRTAPHRSAPHRTAPHRAAPPQCVAPRRACCAAALVARI
jgi:hypothetical protein